MATDANNDNNQATRQEVGDTRQQYLRIRMFLDHGLKQAQAVYARLWNGLYQDLYCLVLRQMPNDNEAAERITHDAITRGWDNLWRFHYGDNLLPWLLTIARHQIQDEKKHNRRFVSLSPHTGAEVPAPNTEAEISPPRGEIAELVSPVLTQLNTVAPLLDDLRYLIGEHLRRAGRDPDQRKRGPMPPWQKPYVNLGDLNDSINDARESLQSLEKGIRDENRRLRPCDDVPTS